MLTASEAERGLFTPGGAARREARLRPDYAQMYPDIRTARWEPAATVADRVLAGRLLQARPIALGDRVLPDAHFEFRGGSERGLEPGGVRPRREDR